MVKPRVPVGECEAVCICVALDVIATVLLEALVLALLATATDIIAVDCPSRNI